MMAAFFLACSLVFLLQFFVWYCRSLISASVSHPLSVEVRDVMNLPAPASGEDFARVTQLLLLCPDRPEDRARCVRSAPISACSTSFAPVWRAWSLPLSSGLNPNAAAAPTSRPSPSIAASLSAANSSLNKSKFERRCYCSSSAFFAGRLAVVK